MRLIFDIETDGLLPELTTVHSLVIKDMDRGWVISAGTGDGYEAVSEALGWLTEADELIGHNILEFDIPAIQKVYPWFQPKGKIIDTLILSRLIWPDMKERDFQNRARLIKKNGKDRANQLFPTKMIGRHSLEAWGRRLGEWKGDYAEEREAELKGEYARRWRVARIGQIRGYIVETRLKGKKPTKSGVKRLGSVGLPHKAPTKDELTEYVWGSWNQSMQDYCEQDVEVTHKFYERILSKNYSQRAIDLEHDFAFVIHLMENEGIPFDDEAADSLERDLMVRKAEIEQELQEYFPPWEVRVPFTPKRDNKKLGYKAGKLTHKVKTVHFNPGSRDHIADRLIAQRGWEPTEFTDTGKPKVDETILKKLTDWPEAKLLEEYFLITKRLGQLSDGPQAWRNNVRSDGRIYHSVVTNGTPTSRCTHKNPNLAQVPKVKTDKEGNIKWGRDGAWGAECRGLFHAPEGMVMVGADLSGLELRCLAHYMARYDDGAYIKTLLEGDVHTVNQQAAGLPSRDNAKTFIYGFLYGAGDEKIGSIVGKGKKEGAKLKKAFLDRTPALKELRNAVRNKTAKMLWINGKKRPNPKHKGYLVGLDGRHLPIRYQHAALNTLLQSAGALISKEATVVLYRDLTTRGYVFGKDWALMLHVHDEVQLWARPEIADEVGEAAVAAFEQAGRNFDFRCPITGEYKKGETWRDTH